MKHDHWAWRRVRSTCRCTGSRNGQSLVLARAYSGLGRQPLLSVQMHQSVPQHCSVPRLIPLEMSHSKKRPKMGKTGQTRHRACMQKRGEYSKETTHTRECEGRGFGRRYHHAWMTIGQKGPQSRTHKRLKRTDAVNAQRKE